MRSTRILMIKWHSIHTYYKFSLLVALIATLGIEVLDSLAVYQNLTILQIANPPIFGLKKFVRFAGTFRKCDNADLWSADPMFFAICGFAICEPNFLGDLKLPQIFKTIIVLLTNIGLKCSYSHMYKKLISLNKSAAEF